MVVQDRAADRGVDELAIETNRLGANHVLIVVRDGQVDDIARVAQADRAERFHFAHFQRQGHFFNVGERAAFALRARLRLGQVVQAEHHVLRRNGDRVTRRRRQNVVRGQHQNAGFHLRFRRKRNVHGHLVAVEIGVERRADQRVNLDGLTFHQHRLKCLDAQTVQGWSAVQKNRVILNYLFEDVPNDRFLRFHHFFRLLDGGAVTGLFEPVIDERLEQLERHLLRADRTGAASTPDQPR